MANIIKKNLKELDKLTGFVKGSAKYKKHYKRYKTKPRQKGYTQYSTIQPLTKGGYSVSVVRKKVFKDKNLAKSAYKRQSIYSAKKFKKK